MMKNSTKNNVDTAESDLSCMVCSLFAQYCPDPEIHVQSYSLSLEPPPGCITVITQVWRLQDCGHRGGCTIDARRIPMINVNSASELITQNLLFLARFEPAGIIAESSDRCWLSYCGTYLRSLLKLAPEYVSRFRVR